MTRAGRFERQLKRFEGQQTQRLDSSSALHRRDEVINEVINKAKQ
jgi:hypothetical protein